MSEGLPVRFEVKRAAGRRRLMAGSCFAVGLPSGRFQPVWSVGEGTRTEVILKVVLHPGDRST